MKIGILADWLNQGSLEGNLRKAAEMGADGVRVAWLLRSRTRRASGAPRPSWTLRWTLAAASLPLT